jgi:hypothetical protein
MIDLKLSWKSLDSEQIIFEEGSMNPWQKQQLEKNIQEILVKMKKSWTKKITRRFDIPSSSDISFYCGPYSVFFLLPRALSKIIKHFPHTSFYIQKQDFDREKFHNQNKATCFYIIGRNPQNIREFENIKKEACVMRGFKKDDLIISIEKSIKTKAIEEANILYIAFKKNNRDRLKKAYEFIPINRQNESPRVISDDYFLSYVMMLNKAGIGHAFSASMEKSKLAIITKKTGLIRALAHTKKTLNKEEKVIAKLIHRSINNKS